MSTTPRTDDFMCKCPQINWNVPTFADFARTLETELEASRKEVELNTAEWATLMADVHDYFKDERCDRGHGRVRLLLTLLGGLRCQRDDARAEVERLRGALSGLLSEWEYQAEIGAVPDNRIEAAAARLALATQPEGGK